MNFVRDCYSRWSLECRSASALMFFTRDQYLLGTHSSRKVWRPGKQNRLVGFLRPRSFSVPLSPPSTEGHWLGLQKAKAKTTLERSQQRPSPPPAPTHKAPLMGKVCVYDGSNLWLSPPVCSQFSVSELGSLAVGQEFWSLFNKLGLCKEKKKKKECIISCAYEQNHSLEKNTHPTNLCSKQVSVF